MNNEKIMTRTYKIFITLILIVIFLIFTLKEFSKDDLGKNVESMIGPEFSGGSTVSIRDNFILRSAIDIYIQTIHSGDLDGAYNYLLPQYREFVSKEIYISKMNGIGLENFVVKSMELNRETENMFSFDILLTNETLLKLLLILTEDNYYIVPEPFLKYEEIDEKITKKGVTYILKGYQVDVERCIFDMVISNNNSDEVEIHQVKMTNTAGGVRNAVNQKTKLKPNETIEISYKVETHLDFPSTLEIARKDGDKMRVYTFELSQ